MAELTVRMPGEPDRVVRLERFPAMIGRSLDCEVQFLEGRASRRHARICRLPGGGYAVEDLGSGNGTIVGEERVLRRRLLDGDVIRIGETTLTFSAPDASPAAPPPAAPPAPVSVVGGRVLVEEVVPGSPAAPPPAPSAAGAPARGAGGVRKRAAEERALRRSYVFAGVGVAALVAALTLVPSIAEKRLRPAREAAAYVDLLGRADLSFEGFERDVHAFEAKHPGSRHLPALREYLAARRAIETRRRAADEEIERLQRQGDATPASEAMDRLLALRRQNPDLPTVVRRVDLLLEGVAQRARNGTRRDADAAIAAADAALARNDPAAALRALAAFHARHPGLSEEERAPVWRKEEAALGRVREVAEDAVASAKATTDLDARRDLLARALLGLAGTTHEERVRDALRAGVPGGASASGPAPGAGSGGAAPGPSTPAAPAISPEVVARSAEAERLARARSWAAAAAAYDALTKAEAPAALREAWGERAAELRRVAGLVVDLDAAVRDAGDKPVRVKLDDGPADVVAATSEGVSLRRGADTRVQTWGAFPARDLLAILSRPKPTPDQRLATALLAVDLGDRAAAMAELVALAGVESHRDLAFRVVARRVHGRKDVPEGGYSVDGGELVDAAELARRQGARQVAALEAEAAAIVGKLAAEPAYKKLDAVRERREELDRRRAHALLAIFNEKHYPYPKEPPDAYAVVQAEIDARITAVEEAWNDPVSAHPGKAESVRKLLARHAQLVEELGRLGKDPTAALEAVRPYALHATGEPLTVRTYFRDEEERDVLEYNRWVMREHNPLKNEVATEAEREQVRITNEYRMMMGWCFVVEPGAAAIAAVEGSSVAKILDEAREKGRTFLRAVRIDDRLVRAARGHSEDMGKRGFFAHTAPADAERGLPATNPFDRMATAGYAGGAASENIAQGQSDPQGAHMAWRHSSGHHRNLLSFWVDMGAGQSTKFWTQNFGVGGGPEPVIPGRAPADTTPGGEGTPRGVNPDEEAPADGPDAPGEGAPPGR